VLGVVHDLYGDQPPDDDDPSVMVGVQPSPRVLLVGDQIPEGVEAAVRELAPTVDAFSHLGGIRLESGTPS